MEWKKNFTRKKLLIWPDFFFLPLANPIFKRIFFLSGGKNYVFCVEVKFYFLGYELSGEKKFKDRICLCFLCGTESNFFVKNNFLYVLNSEKHFFSLGKRNSKNETFLCV